MTDETAFLRAAAAQPDDDTLRLVYADWLDEQGGEAFESQAAFVRLQVRRSRRDVFDPDRTAFLEEEAQLLQKHKRDWNGRIHRALHLRGVFGLVDARRGLIRKWDYHRGMIARVTLPADGLTAHSNFVSALGPVQAIELVGWRNWTRAEEQALTPLLSGLKTVTLRPPTLPTGTLVGFAPLRHVSLLDLRSHAVASAFVGGLLHAARTGELPPVVLFRRNVTTHLPAVGGYVPSDSRHKVHVIDPHNKWDAMRLWFADFTGELLDPVRV